MLCVQSQVAGKYVFTIKIYTHICLGVLFKVISQQFFIIEVLKYTQRIYVDSVYTKKIFKNRINCFFNRQTSRMARSDNFYS
mgnify:CR=1 FL=1